MVFVEPPNPGKRSLLIHEVWPALVCLGVAFGPLDGSGTLPLRIGRNRPRELVGPGSHVAVYLQQHGPRVRASFNRNLANWTCNGGEHHPLARPTTPCHALIRRGVLLGAQQSREE